jgi:hypothetical protein
MSLAAVPTSRSVARGWCAPASSRSRMLAVALACAAALTLLCALPVPAGADVFGPISLVSQGPFGGELEQAEYAHDPAISGNGDYVAFDGSFGGVTGVWRRDLQTGAVEQVAGGDAELPSISEDGQYVSFTTNEDLTLPAISHGRPDATPHAEAVNVYVRNMGEQPAPTESEEAARPAGERAFTVISAVDGSEEPLTYAGGSTDTGSAAVGRSAIDAAGNEVAFVTTAVSNLVRYPKVEKEEEEKGETPKPHTPKLQVAVRYLDTRATILVSRCYIEPRCEPAAEPAVSAVEGSTDYGAVYPGQSASFEPSPPYGDYSLSPPPGASLSADGSTVAWMGDDIGQQAPLLSEETRNPDYTEPLWRRIEPGSETATERVTGGSDPGNPACAASGEGSLPASASTSDPCQGPFIVEEQTPVGGILNVAGGQTGDFVPRLSADGELVAFVSQAPLVTAGENFGRGKSGQESDLYVASMAPGLTRDQALTQVTELAGGEGAGLADTAPIFDFDISPDGLQVAFATVRTRFPLGSPAFVSTPAGEPGMNELYDADLADGTLTRVTHGYQSADEAGEHPHEPAPAGEDPYKAQPGDGALSPSFSSDGDLLAFSSTASNLVFGDGNSPPLGLPQTGSFDGSDAFAVSRTLIAATPTPNESSPAPEPAFEPAWNIGVTALSRTNGTVLLYVRAPGVGSLQARARGAVVVASARGARGAHGARAAHHTRRASRARVIEAVVTRTVATGATGTTGAGLTTLTLTLAPFYAALARERGGLSATVTVTFTAPGRPALHATIPVTFLRAEKGAKTKRGAAARSRKRSPRKASGRSSQGGRR